MLKLGKQPARHDARTLHYDTYRDPTTAVTVPTAFGHYKAIYAGGWGMLGNDHAGDCVFAGGDHEHMLWLAEHSGVPSFSSAGALADYAAVTGYDPADPSTDQGTVVLAALNYRRRTGLLDARGARHKIAAFVALEPGNLNHVLEAAYLFGAVGMGFAFPDSAMDQFNAGKTWSVAPGATIDGGHYVPIVGATSTHLLCVTWGKVQAMTHGFFAKYCDEAWALLSREHFAAGKTPEGFNTVALNADLKALAA